MVGDNTCVDGTPDDASKSDSGERTTASMRKDGLARELAEAQPDATGLDKARLRAKLSTALFGAPAEPVKLGRFVILGRLGQGGMSVVYDAYDPKLDRRVALKLLGGGHGRRGHGRLLREARALARLSHPNVVPVHEVGELDEKVFLVMELVEGQDLRAWAEAAPRSWREVVEVYRQAGAGLAAAHALGLVHRDFKPGNAVIGADGRVRVIDFGLVREHRDDSAGDPAPEPPPGDGSTPAPEPAFDATALTEADTILGTPAYMSPEQFESAEVGPASDQFSFCAALYEALWGGQAYQGRDWHKRREEVLAGRLREPGKGARVPGWLWPIVGRGLQRDPDQRHPSMAALVEALGRDPAQARRRRLLAVAALALVAVTAASLWKAGDSAAVCTGGADQLAAVWSWGQRQRVASAIRGVGGAYAEEVLARVYAALGDYGRGWVSMHHEACMAHRRGEQSNELLDRRMACLDRRLQAFDSAVEVLSETDADTLANAVQVSLELPAIDVCADPDALLAEVPPPQDPATVEAVAKLRRRLARVDALEAAGRYQDALTVAQAAGADAGDLEYPPVTAEALVAEGRMLLHTGSFEAAIAPLTRASRIAAGEGMSALAVEAIARQIFVEAQVSRGYGDGRSDVLRLLPLADALSQHAADRGFARALLFNNAGVLHMHRGDSDEARGAFEHARTIVQEGWPNGQAPLELLAIGRNLAMLTDSAAERDRLLGETIEILAEELGPEHPLTLYHRLSLGVYSESPLAGYEILAPTCALYQRYHAERAGELDECLYYLGFVAAELGRDPEELAAWRALAERPETRPKLPMQALAGGYAELLNGRPEAAVARLEAIAAPHRDYQGDDWALHLSLAEAELGIGLGLVALDRSVEAQVVLASALARLEANYQPAAHAIWSRRLSRVRVALATALWPGGSGTSAPAPAVRARAATLLDAAEAWYRQGGAGYEHRLAELSEWRRARGLPPGASSGGAAQGEGE
ncbi:protein kinase domain-containing protein [Haliangium sp.]|uniref:serine/threonine-protein kinase n=1 Tax=Haliangium sp. TaxID=2663208 RepID=UPI003D0B019B